MKKFSAYLSILICLLIQGYFSFGDPTQSKIAIGLLVDESGIPVSNAKVSVDGSQFYTTDIEGKFKMVLKKKLSIPLNVIVNKEGYQLKTFTISDSQEEIDIIVKKVPFDYSELTFHFIDENKKPIASTFVTVDGFPFKTDNKGKVLIPTRYSNKTSLSATGYTVRSTKFFEKENRVEIIAIKKQPTVVAKETVKEPETPTPANSEEVDSLSKEKLNLKVYNEYKDGFEDVTKELIAEQIRVEGNNQKIRDEIQTITNRLQNEKNLNPQQRKELNRQVEKMETMVLENTKAFEKSQERTNYLILKLKSTISQKDLIYEETIKKLALVEKENRITARKAKRNLIIFSIITLTLLILAMVFYSIARKMRTHRKELMKSNEELQGIREQLTQKTEEIALQLKLIEEQKKLLSNR